MTPLDKPLRRAAVIDGRDFVITLTPSALKITQKGRRLGLELKWSELVRGESALAVALQASVGKFDNDIQNHMAPPPLRASTKSKSPGKRKK